MIELVHILLSKMLYHIAVVALDAISKEHTANCTIFNCPFDDQVDSFSQEVSYGTKLIRVDIGLRNHIYPEEPGQSKSIPFIGLFL